MIRTRVGTLLMACALTTVIASPVLGQSTTAQQTPPVKMGTSGGSLNDTFFGLVCCGGTLGSLVLYDGQQHILSNNHVLARSGLAVAGEDTLQPGLIDKGCNGATANVIADFAGNLVPLGTGNVDAALAKTRAGQVDTTGAILNVGVPCSNIQAPTVGLPVAKSGRTTGYTTGTIQSINLSVTVQYQRGCGFGVPFSQSFTNQISITPGTFSAGGDSGSLIVSNDATKNPVGLLFAGSSAQTIANPAQSVINAFTAGGHTFSFVGTSCPVPSVAGLIPGISEAEVEFVTSVKKRHEKKLFARPDVLGVGVGKLSDDEDSTEGAIILYVASNTAQRSKGLPRELDGVKVRVIPTDPFVARCE